MSFRLERENSKAFFECPFAIYPKSFHFVSQFKSDLERQLDFSKNPLFINHGRGTFFTLHEGKDVLGRIVAHIHDSSNARHDLSRAYFGYFDCIDDPKAAEILLGVAEDWGSNRGCNEIAGNINLTAMQQLGILTEGFDKFPYTDQIYSPEHIHRLLECSGYERFFPMTTFEVDLANVEPNLLITSEKIIASEKKYAFRYPKKSQFHKFSEEARLLLNLGFIDNPMFVPLTEEEFLFQIGEMVWIMDEKITLIAYKDEAACGVVICIPDINPLLKATRSRCRWNTPYYYLRGKLSRNRAVMILFSVLPEHQKNGLGSLLVSKALESLIERGYRLLGTTWVGDDNARSLRLIQKMHGVPMHRLHIYRKDL